MPTADSPTAIVCDTTAYLPTAMVDAAGIQLVSLYVTLEGQEDRESELRDYDDFYDRLRKANEPATTSQPSVGDFEAVYRPLLDQGREIVSLHLSAGISGTYETACQARDGLAGDGDDAGAIHVIDSRTTAGGMGLVVLAACAAASRGMAATEVAARTHQAREALKMWFALDTLEYLRRGGRIGGASAFIGSALKVKPILTFEEEVVPVERVRTRSRVRERLLDYARDRHAAGSSAWVVQHIQDPEGADDLVASALEVFGREPTFVSEVGPVIGAHAGPGMLVIGTLPESLLE